MSKAFCGKVFWNNNLFKNPIVWKSSDTDTTITTLDTDIMMHDSEGEGREGIQGVCVQSIPFVIHYIGQEW